MTTTQSLMATNIGILGRKLHRASIVFDLIQSDVAGADSVEDVEESLFYLYASQEDISHKQYEYLKGILEQLRDHFLMKENV